MRLVYTASYVARGLDEETLVKLAMFGDIILEAGFNVTRIRESEEIERGHFLDSLSLLDVGSVLLAKNIVDIGSGAGIPALVLALALPDVAISAVESQHKKCAFIEAAIERLGLENVTVNCVRAEEYGRGRGRLAHDVAVSRALGPLSVVAEYSLPLLRLGGTMVAMKGSMSNQERTQGARALGILGAEGLDEVRLCPFVEAENRWAYVATKARPTPAEYPRRPGIPTKRPLGT